MNYKKMIRVMALVMSASIALMPVTAFANEPEGDVVVEQEMAETEETSATAETDEEVVAEATEITEDVTEETEETTEETEETTEEVAEEVAVEEENADVNDPSLDKKALKLLTDAASYQESLGYNSLKKGLASTSQVDRCRNLAKNLLIYKLNYMDGMLVIGTAYDMLHGDNNYIRVDYKDVTTGEIYEKYYDFYMQDSNGNNVTNALKYYTVDRIAIVEKGALTGQKKIGMYVYPTFESKSNGNVVFDYDTYSQLISSENIATVSSMIG